MTYDERSAVKWIEKTGKVEEGKFDQRLRLLSLYYYLETGNKIAPESLRKDPLALARITQEMQQRLRDNGYKGTVGKVDGKLGENTEWALKEAIAKDHKFMGKAMTDYILGETNMDAALKSIRTIIPQPRLQETAVEFSLKNGSKITISGQMPSHINVQWLKDEVFKGSLTVVGKDAKGRGMEPLDARAELGEALTYDNKEDPQITSMKKTGGRLVAKD